MNLISAAALHRQINAPQTVVIDCRFNLIREGAGHAAYIAGHIPGAVYADLDADLASPVSPDGAGGRHPLPDPQACGELLRTWGVNDDSLVVVYDAAGGMVAARLWWLLRWLGHEQVALLDGGLPAWTSIGGGLSIELPEPARGNFSPRPGAMPIVDAEQVAKGLADGSIVLLDARDPQRFAGLTEPLDKLAGHVPGAINTPLTDNLTTDKCFRPIGDLQAYYGPAIQDRLGNRQAEKVVCMCGSGVTACHTLLALETAGLKGAALYVGSWSDWISSGQRPVAVDQD